MSVQTSYTDLQPIATRGMIADGGNHEIMSGFNFDTVSIPFGSAVAFGASPTSDQDMTLPISSSVISGFVCRSDEYARTWTIQNPDGTSSVAGDLDGTGVVAGGMLNVMRRGRIWVIAELACVPGDRLWVRYSTNATGTVQGGVGNASDAGHNIDATRQGVFLTTAAAGGLAIVEFDFTNRPT